MKIELTYDGQFVKLAEEGHLFKALSGMPAHQIPGEQCVPDAGPYRKGFIKSLYLIMVWQKTMEEVFVR
jgi:hypothetical protein